MKNKQSVKMSEEAIMFLKRFAANRVKADVELETLTPSDALEIIEKYFKLNNDKYLEMVRMVRENA